jgi:hypothetical protein
MSLDAIIVALNYLLGFYWPYLLGALAIGLVAGWFSYSKRET